MLNQILSGLGRELKSRVWDAYKSSLLAVALAVGDTTLSYLGTVQLPTWAHYAVGLASTLLLFYRGKVAPAAAAAVVLALCLAGPARAADTAPAAQLTIGSVKGAPLNLAFGLGFSGYAYDFGTKQVTKAVQFTGLAELSAGAFPLALLAGGGFQTGTNQGLALQVGPEYRPLNVAALFTSVVVGATKSYGVAAGYVVRF